MVTRSKEKIKYFDWLYSQAFCNDSYRELASHLFDTPFEYVIEMDENRYKDGLYLRYIFGIDLGDEPCSMLEMMVALARGIEDILTDNKNDRTSKWVELMLNNSDLAKFDDNYMLYFGDRACEELHAYLDDIIYRTYPKNGNGSLFPTERDVDMRRVELWHQATWYIVDNNLT